MPILYLSPSTQPYNLYVTGGSEQDFMNSLANAMQPYLEAAGIQVLRKPLTSSAADAISASNAGDFDLHLALHSNASPEGMVGEQRGIIVFYRADNAASKKASTRIADALRVIYPLPDAVRIEPSDRIGEVTRVSAPSAFLEIGYHDNRADALWITENIEPLAQSISHAVADYFGTPFLSPVPPRAGRVDIENGTLNIRERPTQSAAIIATAVKGAPLTIVNQYKDWYLVRIGKLLGYASADYIRPA